MPLAEQAWRARWHALQTQPWQAIIPIALDKKRQRARGYNQASYLARVLGAHLSTQTISKLVRTRRTVQQVGLNKADRIRNVEGAFAWRGKPLAGAVILVDDVVTTSATLSSAAIALKKGGASEVWACTLAYETLE